ncbi:MAG: uracil-DNA glycosylase, partial [Rhodospirillaceae bacterium]|nr:uracil-DNA glycosylase [Rhodospirillaceae bacterium]
SVELGIPTPPSLRNIYKELKNDLGIEPPNHGNLEHWAREGVLLINTCLTVENGIANSHQGQGWEIFTDAVLSVINAEKVNIVFVLWGRKAQKKKKIIDISKHLIIESAHPSPLSAHNGFFGSRPFSKINSYLSTNNLPPVNWNFK